MLTEAQKDWLAAELNRQSLAVAARGAAEINALQERVPAILALGVVVQSLLTAAVSRMVTARAQGFQVDPGPAVHAALDHILKLQIRHHEARPDGSFDPNGVSFN